MGDRVLYQVVKGEEFSPVVYAHWAGSNAPNVLQCLKNRMLGRAGDVQYTAARLVQEVIGNDDANTGFGIWNADKILTADDTHDDAGVVLIDVSEIEHKYKCFGGYLKVEDGKVKVPNGY